MKYNLSSDRIKSAMIVALVRIELDSIGASLTFALSFVDGVILSLLMNGFPDSGHPSNSLSRSCKVGKDGISCSNASLSSVGFDDSDQGCDGS